MVLVWGVWRETRARARARARVRARATHNDDGVGLDPPRALMQ